MGSCRTRTSEDLDLQYCAGECDGADCAGVRRWNVFSAMATWWNVCSAMATAKEMGWEMVKATIP